MVKAGNVRLDISIDSDLEKRLRAALQTRGMAKKGGISAAVSQALESWMSSGNGRR